MCLKLFVDLIVTFFKLTTRSVTNKDHVNHVPVQMQSVSLDILEQ